MPLDQPHDREGSFFEAGFSAHRWWWNPLMRHVEELRYRLLLALMGPVAGSLVTLYYGKELVSWLLRPGLSVLAAMGLPPYFLALGVTSGFSVYLKVSLAAGVAVSSPWIAYQLWRLVSPRLPATGRRVMGVIAPFSAAMAGLAVGFLYYVLLPVGLAFLLFFSAALPAPDLAPPAGDSVLQRLTGLAIRSSRLDLANARPLALPAPRDQSPTPGGESQAPQPPPTPLPILAHDPSHPPDHSYWFSARDGEIHAAVAGHILRFRSTGGGPILRPNLDLDRYVNFVAMMGLGIVIAFQLPVVMLILGWSGTLDPRWLRRYRKYCVFGCFVFGAVFTPTPDPFNMMVLTLPLWALFELGMVLMWLAYRRRGV